MKVYNGVILTIIMIAALLTVWDDHVWNTKVIRYRAYDSDAHKFRVWLKRKLYVFDESDSMIYTLRWDSVKHCWRNDEEKLDSLEVFDLHWGKITR